MKNLMTIWIVCMLLLTQSCISNTAFQTGRTVGADRVEIIIGTSASDYESTQLGESGLNFDQFPENQQFHGSIRVGLTDKLEYNFNGSIGYTIFSTDNKLKYQIIGDQESKFAASIGLGMSFDVIYIGLDLPTYFSFHPSPKFAVYTSPRYRFAITPVERKSRNHAIGLRKINPSVLNNIHQLNIGVGFKF